MSKEDVLKTERDLYIVFKHDTKTGDLYTIHEWHDSPSWVHERDIDDSVLYQDKRVAKQIALEEGGYVAKVFFKDEEESN